MHDHLRSFGEKRSRAGLRVKDAREGRRAAQFDAVLRRNGGRTHEQKQNGAKPRTKRKHAPGKNLSGGVEKNSEEIEKNSVS